jgi:hypothetical protein
MPSRRSHQDFSIDYYTANLRREQSRKPMPSFRTISIALAASLGLFLGFMWWWDGRTVEPPVRHAEALATTPQVSLGTVQSTRPFERTPGPRVRAISANTPAAETAGNSTDDAVASSPPAPPLPVLVFFYRRMADPDHKIEGSIENRSNDPLTITMRIVSSRTRAVSESTLDVAANSRTTFGRDDGLDLGVSDQVTLQSPTYGDLVQEIRRVQ